VESQHGAKTPSAAARTCFLAAAHLPPFSVGFWNAARTFMAQAHAFDDRDYSQVYRALRRSFRRNLGIAGILTAIIIGFGIYTELLNLGRLASGIPAIWQLMTEMVPPDFTRWQEWITPLLDTLGMSIVGTTLAVLGSVPLAFLAAETTTPSRWAYTAARGIMNLLRSVPELIMGIVFVAAVGFGTLPGVLALGLHSIGMVGKFFAESIEHVDPKPIEAARAAGASNFQVIYHAVLPQVLPQMADVTVYRWEYNFRASTVLGMVGAGGIGFEIMSSLRILDYQQVCALLICTLLMVTLVDQMGALLRRRLK
jgi:phosphonate transport system permease protein